MPETVSSENFHFWLTSLQLIAQAEQVVSQDGNNKPVHLRLMSAGSSYVQAVNTLKVRYLYYLVNKSGFKTKDEGMNFIYLGCQLSSVVPSIPN